VLVPEALQAEAGQPSGLTIMRVDRDDPAAKAGIVVGHILVTLDGQGVSRPSMVTEHLGPESIDRPVQLWLMRAGKVVALGAIVAAQPFN
jgi:S1-C subfamily serine protease